MPSLTLPRVLQVADSLPSVPRVLADLQELLKDTNSGLDEVTELLRRDAGMTARVIRIANSIVYNKGDPVASLEEALARVGFGEVYRLAGMASIAQLANFHLRFYPVSAQRLRENALFVALAMEELARFAGTDGRVAYTCGLLRSAGKIVLDATAQRDLRYIPAPPLPPTGLLDWENGLFGLTNQRVAEALLRSWRFPVEVHIPIRDHYLVSLVVDPFPEAKLLHLGAAVADAHGLGIPGEAPFWLPHFETIRGEFGLDDEVLGGIAERTVSRFEQMREALT